MKFSIDKENLAHLLYLANTIVERRNTMPILGNVLLNAEKNSLAIAATDLAVSLIGEAKADVVTPGKITVDAKVFYEIVKELPEQKITLSVGERQRLEIQCGQARFKINGAAADEFPTVAGVSLKNPVSFDAAKLYEMFDRTAFAVSNDETRHNINGVYLQSIDGTFGPRKRGLRLVSTDGHRLAMIDREADGFSLDSAVIIPRKGIQEIKKVLENDEGAAKISVDDGFFTIQSGNVTLGVRLVDGQFPDYKQVIPLETKTKVTVDRNSLLSAIKRVALVTTDKTKAVKCKLIDGNLLVSSFSPEYGEASDSLEVEQDGENLTIGFSAKYMIDLLSAMTNSDQVDIKLNGEVGPGLFIGSSDEFFSCIVMPMRFE